MGLDRRNFVKTSGAALGLAGLAGLSAPSSAAASQLWPSSKHPLIAKNDVILFQGDSITDMSRSRDDADIPNKQAGLGNGYAWLAAAEMLVDHANEGLTIYNRGVSGNKVYQLAERWSKECLRLNPNVLSILIGVNDFWHTLNGSYHGTVEVYEKDYRALIERTLKALPKVKLVICEPFTLRCGHVNEKWFPDFDAYRAAARRVAETYRATFVPFQMMFDEATKYAPSEHWAADGVHPTDSGASLMAHNWIRTVGGKKG